MKHLNRALSRLRFWLWVYSRRLRQAKTIIKELYANVDGVSLSKQDPARRDHESYEFVYGEINFYTLASILDFIKPQAEMTFYDLGSGTGRAVVTAALLYPFKKVYGIELFSSLPRVSVNRKSTNDTLLSSIFFKTFSTDMILS